MGRRKTPAEIAEKKGNPGRRPIEGSAADAAPDLPANDQSDLNLDTLLSHSGRVAKKIGQQAKRIHELLHDDLKQLKILKGTDENAFSRYCVYWAEWWHFTNQLHREGFTYKTDSEHVKGIKRPHPAFRFRKEIEQALREMEDRFGLSPAMRQRIQMQMAQGLGAGAPARGEQPPRQSGEDGAAQKDPAQTEMQPGFLNTGGRTLN